MNAHPKIWRTHFAKGQLLLALGRYDEALRSANTAKSLVHGVLAEPCILTGQILYAKDDLDAGRREFDEAARIHPSNLTARFGPGEYFEHKDNYMSALLEYSKLEQEFVGSPLVMERIGRCYKQLKRWDKAAAYYGDALGRYKELGAAPAEESYFELGYILWNVQRYRNLAIPVYAEYLAFHGDSPRAHEAHMQLADAYRDFGEARVGIAYGHLTRAWTLRPDTPQIREALEKPGLRPMSIEDIDFMLNVVEYHPVVVADIVEVTKLNFRLDLENEQHIKLLQDHEIPAVVVQAILTSNRRQGTAEVLPNQGAPAKGRAAQKPAKPNAGQLDQAAQPDVAGPPAVIAALAGSWAGKTNVAFLKYEVSLTFTPDGQYTLVSHDLNDGSVMTTPGTYTATASSIKMITEEGSRMETTYQIAGNRLVIHQLIGYINPITFTKQNQ